jgi:hypothetical protein
VGRTARLNFVRHTLERRAELPMPLAVLLIVINCLVSSSSFAFFKGFLARCFLPIRYAPWGSIGYMQTPCRRLSGPVRSPILLRIFDLVPATSPPAAIGSANDVAYFDSSLVFSTPRFRAMETHAFRFPGVPVPPWELSRR